jgi:hypothetical protein
MPHSMGTALEVMSGLSCEFAFLGFRVKPFSYPAALRIIDHVAVTLGQALMLARSRIASLPSPILQMMAERDHAHSNAELLQRELEVFRAQRENMQPHKRPEYPPEQRLAILQIMRLRGWNEVVTAM